MAGKKELNWCSKHQRAHKERKHKSCRYPNDMAGKKKRKFDGKELTIRIRTGYTDLSGTEIKLTAGLIAMLLRSAYNQPSITIEEI